MMESEDRFWPYPGATDPEAYEQLNLGTDPDQQLERCMWALAPIEGRVVLDIGAGSGFHALRYAAYARHVFALEPDRRMRQQFFQRLLRHAPENVSVLALRVGHIPLADASVEVAYARFAYFFGTDDCLPGMRQVKRVLVPDGSFFVIEAHSGRGQLGRINRQIFPDVFSDEREARVNAFFTGHGFEAHVVDSVLRVPERQMLAKILQMDYGPENARTLLAQITGTELSCSFWVFHYRQPGMVSS